MFISLITVNLRHMFVKTLKDNQFWCYIMDVILFTNKSTEIKESKDQKLPFKTSIQCKYSCLLIKVHSLAYFVSA